MGQVNDRRESWALERFRASGPSSRCTASREKRPNSGALQGRSLGREGVGPRRVGRGRGTVVEPSMPHFQWLTNHTTVVDVASRISTRVPPCPSAAAARADVGNFASRRLAARGGTLRSSGGVASRIRCLTFSASAAFGGHPPRLSALPCKEDWPSFENGRMPQRRRCPAGKLHSLTCVSARA
jgi:hypothetical protein